MPILWNIIFNALLLWFVALIYFHKYCELFEYFLYRELIWYKN